MVSSVQGVDWGLHGFSRVVYGADSPDNACWSSCSGVAGFSLALGCFIALECYETASEGVIARTET